MADRPRVPQGARLFEPPEGVAHGPFWDRVLELRHEGMPWTAASKLARQEALGVRRVDGGPARPARGRRIRNERGERLDRQGNVVPNPMPPLTP